ncbi:hypothetical protein HELRODRAFT_66470 [Helobdella robusta]|uniref:Glycoside hydrolase family 3 N-terminal domain-containing protein n=1 Tax=Helobdella robusta TaxID=6412 RepID=T1FYL5_HELRO|nr:hypothetical protein HELRODRAFT_66470 [Helobdella robusta]ESN99355.1 hypothetical protein HELRODRAFT_66470 [Helobdella robusta]
MRHPLWGRVQEIYGEDPFLSGWLTEAYVTGLQGDHPRYIKANAGCKTLAAHSGPENIPSSRFSFDAKVSERDMRLTYLPHWAACINAGSMNIMCSYNSFNGIPACGNKRLMQEIARGELGFKGYFISDWEAIRFIYTGHKYTKSLMEAVVLAANSGVDLELPGKDPAYKLLYDAVVNGLVRSFFISFPFVIN